MHISMRANVSKNLFKSNFNTVHRYGQSPCFLEASFMQLVGPDYPLLVLPCIDGEEFLKCAF